MKSIYKSAEGERAVRERYLKFLAYWPVPNQQLRVPTCEGETFVVVSGPETAPALVLLHGASGNTAMWMGLHLEHASFLGVSNGGWLALNYATRHPQRVESLVVLCPGGIVRAKNILLKVFPFLLLGKWGARKVREMILGRTPANLSKAHQAFADFIALIFRHLRPRTARHPILSDDQLRRLTMPVMVILGGKDVIFDSAAIQQRLERALPHALIRYLPEAGHFIPGQTAPIVDFLHSKTAAVRSGA